MKKQNWTFEQLKFQLSRRNEIKAWIITVEYVHRRERYFMLERNKISLDQDRKVQCRNMSLRLFVNLAAPGRHGEITKKLFPSLPLENQIDQAIEAALQTDHQAWDLPHNVSNDLPEFLTTDPRMAEDLDQVMTDLTARIEKSVLKERASEFNSAELFLSVHNRELHLSNGLSYRSSQSRVYTETAFSFSRSEQNNESHKNIKSRSDEYLSTHWATHLDHLPIEKIFDEASHGAEQSLETEKPLTGKYSVIVDAEVLSHLLNGHISLLSASNAYNGLPFIKEGEDFITEPKGDLITVTLDPTLDFGANTTALSEQGLIQKPLKLVDKNRVVANCTDKQYGDYLGIPPTTVLGNIVVEPGEMTYKDLTQHNPQVIEILQFSGLFSDPNSGTFSSEIRLAKLYDNENGTVRYLKGGSLSGSISENFQGLRLSKSRCTRSHFSSDNLRGQGYFGPEFALLTQVSIVG